MPFRGCSTTVIAWNLVGSGESYPTCGEWTSWSVQCPGHTAEGDGHTSRHIEGFCGRLNCPVCYDLELWRRAGAAEKRLEFVKKAYYLGGIDLDYVEVIAYPPKDKASWCFGTVEGYEWLKDQLKAVHNDYGILGGVQVTHITAVNRDGGATYAEYEKLRRGEPSRVRYNPHVQEIGLRRADWGRRRDQQRRWTAAGWFVRVLYADGRTDNRAWNSVRKKLAYEMSHAYQGVTQKGTKKTFTTWFGICSYNNVRQDVQVKEKVEKCPQCGLDCWLYEDGVKKELATIKERIFTFWLPDGALERAILKYQLVKGEIRAEDLAPWCGAVQA